MCPHNYRLKKPNSSSSTSSASSAAIPIAAFRLKATFLSTTTRIRDASGGANRRSSFTHQSVLQSYAICMASTLDIWVPAIGEVKRNARRIASP